MTGSVRRVSVEVTNDMLPEALPLLAGMGKIERIEAKEPNHHGIRFHPWVVVMSSYVWPPGPDGRAYVEIEQQTSADLLTVTRTFTLVLPKG